MTSEKIIQACDRYIALFVQWGRAPVRFPADRHAPSTLDNVSHLHWMAIEAKTFAETKREKAQRWVCFIQGSLWALGLNKIDEFKDDNRSSKPAVEAPPLGYQAVPGTDLSQYEMQDEDGQYWPVAPPRGPENQ